MSTLPPLLPPLVSPYVDTSMLSRAADKIERAAALTAQRRFDNLFKLITLSDKEVTELVDEGVRKMSTDETRRLLLLIPARHLKLCAENDVLGDSILAETQRSVNNRHLRFISLVVGVMKKQPWAASVRF
jgi:hypothetical protein